MTAIFVLLLLSPHAGASEEAPPLERALASARSSGRPLFLEIGTVWCKPCALFDQEILPKAFPVSFAHP